jgi:hypothetical protein
MKCIFLPQPWWFWQPNNLPSIQRLFHLHQHQYKQLRKAIEHQNYLNNVR